QQKDQGPDTQEYFPFKESPIAHKVRVGQKFEGQGQFQKAQDHFQGGHPPPGFGQGVQPGGKHGKKGKGKGQGQAKTDHADGEVGRNIPMGQGSAAQQPAQNGARTGKGDDRQGEGHKENAHAPSYPG